MKSKVIKLDLSTDQYSTPTKRDFWIYNKKGRKMVNISLVGRFKKGSYIIDTFMEAALVDQLFLPLKYSQNIGVAEARIYPINKQEEEDEEEDDDEELDGSYE